MVLPFNHNTLQCISRNLAYRGGLWSLAIANEYLESKNPIRLSMAKKLQTDAKSSEESEVKRLSVQLLEGARMRELSPADQSLLLERGGLDIAYRHRARLLQALAKRRRVSTTERVKRVGQAAKAH